MLLHCALTVIVVVCPVSLCEVYKCSFPLGTRSQQEWHRANEPAEIRKGRGYGQLDILERSERFAQSQTALLCRTHIRKSLLLLEFKTLKLVFEPGLRRLLLKRTRLDYLFWLSRSYEHPRTVYVKSQNHEYLFLCIPLSSVEGFSLGYQ